MSNTPILDSLIVFIEGARVNFKLHGNVAPVFGFKVKDREPQLEPVIFTSPKDKDKFRQKILDLIAENKLEEFVFVCEAWVATVKNIEDVRKWLAKYGSLEKFEGRKEVVQVMYCSPEQEICYTATIDRSSIAELGKWEQTCRKAFEIADLQTRFQGLFAQGKSGQN
jgi:16S rRNA G1207 methylase RsmC